MGLGCYLFVSSYELVANFQALSLEFELLIYLYAPNYGDYSPRLDQAKYLGTVVMLNNDDFFPLAVVSLS